MSETIRKTFKYRCYPNIGTARRAQKTMRVFGDIWSNACAERSKAYFKWRDTVTASANGLGHEPTKKELKEIRKAAAQKEGCSVSQYDQYSLIRKRDHPQYAGYYAKSMECVLAEVDGSFKSFYALCKKYPDAAPPNQQRYHSCISYRSSGWKIDGNNLYLKNLGKFRLRMHRPIEGKIKVVSITRKNRRWYASFSCEITNFSGACGPMPASKSSVSQDLQQEHIPPGGTDPKKAGAHNEQHVRRCIREGGTDPKKAGAHNSRGFSNSLFMGGTDPKKAGAHNEVEVKFAFSDGLFVEDSAGLRIPHPEFYFSHIGELRRLSRALSRKKPRSRNRRKARHTLAKFHEHVSKKRDYFLWHVARYYASNYRVVVIPKWPLKEKIQYAVDSTTARKLCDSAYARFVEMLKHKCKEFGTELIERKDQRWQKELKRAMEVKGLESLQKILRKCRKAMKYRNPAHLQSHKPGRERAAI